MFIIIYERLTTVYKNHKFLFYLWSNKRRITGKQQQYKLYKKIDPYIISGDRFEWVLWVLLNTWGLWAHPSRDASALSAAALAPPLPRRPSRPAARSRRRCVPGRLTCAHAALWYSLREPLLSYQRASMRRCDTRQNVRLTLICKIFGMNFSIYNCILSYSFYVSKIYFSESEERTQLWIKNDKKIFSFNNLILFVKF